MRCAAAIPKDILARRAIYFGHPLVFRPNALVSHFSICQEHNGCWIGPKHKNPTSTSLGATSPLQSFGSFPLLVTMVAISFQRQRQVLQKYLPASKPSIFVLVTFTWFLCILSLSRCTFFTQSNVAELQDLQMGLFSRAVNDKDGDILGCLAYTENGSDFIDSNFKAGRAFGIISALCCSITLLFVGVSLLFRPKGSDLLWNMSRFYLAGATLGQMFSFFVLNSSLCQSAEHTCRLSAAGYLALLNVIILGGLTMKLFWEKAPKEPWLSMWSDRLDEETIATDRSGSRQKAKRGTRNVVDPFSGERVDSGSNQLDLHVLELEVDPTNPENDTRNHGTNSIASNVTHQSQQESLVSRVGVQNLKSFRFLTILLLATCWAISIVGVKRCTLLLVGPEDGDRSDFSGLGLFSRAAYHNGEIIGCLAYPDEAKENFDSSFQVSRVFGAITAFLLTIVFFLSALQLFTQYAKDEIWLVLRALLPCSTIAQLLVFIGYKTETCTITDFVECKPGPTGIMVIFNIFLLGILSIGAILVSPPPSPIFRLHQNGDAQQEARPQLHHRQNPAQHLPPQQQAQQIVRNQEDRKLERVRQNGTIENPRKSIPMEPILEASQSVEDISVVEETKKVVRISEEPTESITIRVEFSANEKRTIKTSTHADGSQTITTTVEELDESPETSRDSDADSSEEESEDYDNEDQSFENSDSVDQKSEETPKKESPKNMYMEALKKPSRPDPPLPDKPSLKNMYLDAINGGAQRKNPPSAQRTTPKPAPWVAAAPKRFVVPKEPQKPPVSDKFKNIKSMFESK